MVNLNSQYMYLSNINWNIYINGQSKEICWLHLEWDEMMGYVTISVSTLVYWTQIQEQYTKIGVRNYNVLANWWDASSNGYTVTFVKMLLEDIQWKAEEESLVMRN